MRVVGGFSKLPGHQRIFSLTFNFLFLGSLKSVLLLFHYKFSINSTAFCQIVHLFRSHSLEPQNDDVVPHKSTGYMTLHCRQAEEFGRGWTGISELNPGTSWQSAWSKASPTPAPGGPYHRVHIFTRDETELVCLPTQLERTLQLY